MSTLLILPLSRATDANNNPLSGALLYAYLTETTTPTPTYTTYELDVEHENPIEADANGLFPAVYLDPDITYRFKVKTAAGADIPGMDWDPVTDVVSVDVPDVPDADNSNSETNHRPLEELLTPNDRSYRQRLRQIDRRPGGDVVDSVVPLAVGERRNLWGQSENLASAYYAATLATKQTDTIVVDGITLTRFTTANFYGTITSNVGGLGLTPFVIGQRYLFSYYVMEWGDDTQTTETDPQEKKFYMRALANNNDGFDPKFATNRLRRVWMLGHALSTSTCDFGPSGSVALGGTAAAAQVTWFQSTQNTANTRNIFIGGFQIENCGDAAYKDGIAMIGDSTMAGASGTTDVVPAREVAYYTAGLLNVPVFNRAVGGQRLDQMDARWAADITPLAARCADVLIQGGINDVAQGRTLGQIQTSINSMVAKAVVDGLRPILLTVTPTSSIIATPALETMRQAVNQWIRESFIWVIDIAPIVEDPHTAGYIRDDVLWYGDGIHYIQAAKRAVGAFIASWPGWNKREPGAYQPNLGAQTVWTPPTVALYGTDGKLLNTARGAVVADAVAAAGVPTQAEFNAFVTQFNALAARLRATTGHGLIAG